MNREEEPKPAWVMTAMSIVTLIAVPLVYLAGYTDGRHHALPPPTREQQLRDEFKPAKRDLMAQPWPTRPT